MLDILNRLASQKCEVWLHHSFSRWNIHISTTRDGVKLEVKDIGTEKEDCLTVFTRVHAKFEKITGASPELLPSMLEAPKTDVIDADWQELTGKNSSVILDDDMPF